MYNKCTLAVFNATCIRTTVLLLDPKLPSFHNPVCMCSSINCLLLSRVSSVLV